MARSTLSEYIHHAEQWGPECILETARSDLDERDLGELVAWLDWQSRAHRWRDGRWQSRRAVVTACEECGCDLPVGSRAGTRFHAACRSRAQRRRSKAADTQTA